MGSHRNWVTFVRRMAVAYPAWRFVLPDLRGHGESMGPAFEAPHTVEACAEDVAALFLEHDERRPDAIIGHSFGGKVALRLAQLVTQRQHAEQMEEEEGDFNAGVHAGHVQVWVLDTVPGVWKTLAKDPDPDSIVRVLDYVRRVPLPIASREWLSDFFVDAGFSPTATGWLTTCVRRHAAGQHGVRKAVAAPSAAAGAAGGTAAIATKDPFRSGARGKAVAAKEEEQKENEAAKAAVASKGTGKGKGQDKSKGAAKGEGNVKRTAGWEWTFDPEVIAWLLADYARDDQWHVLEGGPNTPWAAATRAAGGIAWSSTDVTTATVEIDFVAASGSSRWGDSKLVERVRSLPRVRDENNLAGQAARAHSKAARAEEAAARGLALPGLPEVNPAPVRVHVLANAGHWVHVDNPDGLLELFDTSFGRDGRAPDSSMPTAVAGAGAGPDGDGLAEDLT